MTLIISLLRNLKCVVEVFHGSDWLLINVIHFGYSIGFITELNVLETLFPGIKIYFHSQSDPQYHFDCSGFKSINILYSEDTYFSHPTNRYNIVFNNIRLS
jgi:hypothetical protein